MAVEVDGGTSEALRSDTFPNSLIRAGGWGRGGTERSFAKRPKIAGQARNDATSVDSYLPISVGFYLPKFVDTKLVLATCPNSGVVGRG